MRICYRGSPGSDKLERNHPNPPSHSTFVISDFLNLGGKITMALHHTQLKKCCDDHGLFIFLRGSLDKKNWSSHWVIFLYQRK